MKNMLKSFLKKFSQEYVNIYGKSDFYRWWIQFFGRIKWLFVDEVIITSFFCIYTKKKMYYVHPKNMICFYFFPLYKHYKLF